MKYTLCLLTLCSTLFSEIVDVQHFDEIVNYIDADTIVLLDIDDTLLIPSQTLGNDAWFLHRLAWHKASTPTEALDKALAEWEAVRHLTHVKIVEEGSEKVVAQLQEGRIPVMGVTTQGLALATRTVKQLHSLHIDLEKTAPSKEDHYIINERGVLFRNGILFTAGTSKGEALMKLFDMINFTPKRIVFINDKKTHLQDIERSAEARGIPFLGLRYAYSDERVAAFDPKIAEIQWRHSSFGHILSDEEAEQLLEP